MVTTSAARPGCGQLTRLHQPGQVRNGLRQFEDRRSGGAGRVELRRPARCRRPACVRRPRDPARRPSRRRPSRRSGQLHRQTVELATIAGSVGASTMVALGRGDGVRHTRRLHRAGCLIRPVPGGRIGDPRTGADRAAPDRLDAVGSAPHPGPRVRCRDHARPRGVLLPGRAGPMVRPALPSTCPGAGSDRAADRRRDRARRPVARISASASPSSTSPPPMSSAVRSGSSARSAPI